MKTEFNSINDIYKFDIQLNDKIYTVHSYRENYTNKDILEFTVLSSMYKFHSDDLYIRKVHCDNGIYHNCEDKNCKDEYCEDAWGCILECEEHYLQIGCDLISDFEFENPDNKNVYILSNRKRLMATQTNTFSLFNNIYIPESTIPYSIMFIEGVDKFKVKVFINTKKHYFHNNANVSTTYDFDKLNLFESSNENDKIIYEHGQLKAASVPMIHVNDYSNVK